MAGEAPATLDEFSQQLLHWLRQSYPKAAPTTLAMVENQIRETWHRRHDMIQVEDYDSFFLVVLGEAGAICLARSSNISQVFAND